MRQEKFRKNVGQLADSNYLAEKKTNLETR